MMKKSTRIRWIALFPMIILLAGCGEHSTPMEVSKQSVDNVIQAAAQDSQSLETNSAFPTNIQMAEGKVSFNAPIVLEEGADLQKLTVNTATYKTVDKDIVYSHLFKGINTVRSQKNKSGKVIYYDGSKEESLTVSDGGISFFSDQAYHILNTIHLSKQSDRYNLDKYNSEVDFDFSTRTQALENIVSELQQFGIDLGDSYGYQSFSLDYNTMKSEEYVMDQNGKEDPSKYKEDWSPEDNCYYFCIWQTCENLPVASSRFDITGDDAPIQVIYSRRGIEFLTTNVTFDFVSDNAEIKLASLDKIEDCVSGKFNALITDSNYLVKRMTLIDIAQLNRDNTYAINPAWLLDIVEKINDGHESYEFQMLIDAQTAKEIIQ